MRTSQRTLAGTVMSLALLATACGGSTAAGGDTAGNGPDVSGVSFSTAGSSTVGPITELVHEDFAAATGANPSNEVTGTGGGFKDRFCVGATVVNNASRQIKDSEIDLCADNGVTNIIELRIGIDGITVLTSAENDAVAACLNDEELYALLGPGAEGVSSWADANAAVTTHASGEDFPDVQLTTAGPGTESGTYDSFFELALEEQAKEAGTDEKFRSDFSGNNDDNVIVTALQGNQYSLGWVGFAFYTEVQDTLRAFDIADADGNCVAPSEDTIASGAYPLSRDLYIYVNADALEDGDTGEALTQWVDFYLSDAGYDLVSEAGYVQLTPESWDETKAVWDARETL